MLGPTKHAAAALAAAAVVAGAHPALATAAAARPACACAHSGVVPETRTLPEARRALLCLINRERRTRGLRVVRTQPLLRDAAYDYSRELVREQFFSHWSPDGDWVTDRLREADYFVGARHWWVAENLAWGAGRRGTPANTVRRWLRSRSHRKHMLDPAYADIGIGIRAGAPRPVSGAEPAATYVAEFGLRV